MKRFSIVIFSLFCGASVSFAQNVSDSIFTNVIKIEDKNITKLDNRMLIDVSIPTDIEVPIIFFDTSVENKIPRDLLLSLYFYDYNYNVYEYIMFIVPDWNVSKRGKNTKAFTIYKLNRGLDRNHRRLREYSLDSFNIQGTLPKLQFADIKLKDEEVDIYYQKSYGSKCCPKDFSWDFYQLHNDFLDKYTDKIGDRYKIVRGREGQHTAYYTLAGFTAQEKLEFLVHSAYALEELTPKEKLELIEDSFSLPHIYTPFRLNVTRAIKN